MQTAQQRRSRQVVSSHSLIPRICRRLPENHLHRYLFCLLVRHGSRAVQVIPRIKQPLARPIALSRISLSSLACTMAMRYSVPLNPSDRTIGDDGIVFLMLRLMPSRACRLPPSDGVSKDGMRLYNRFIPKNAHLSPKK